MTGLYRAGTPRVALAVLVGLITLFAAAGGAGPAWADHCDPTTDPNCGPHVPDPPPPVDPPCNGSVGPIHAWPCAADQTLDCVQAATSPETCDAVQVTVYPTTVGPVTLNGASTAPINVPVPNAWTPVDPYYDTAKRPVDQVVCWVKTRDSIRCFNAGP
jgi:hypothetical protein